jgi:16S rRNA C967 or C1407 C5-methylase (RsmB/RsmF family)
MDWLDRSGDGCNMSLEGVAAIARQMHYRRDLLDLLAKMYGERTARVLEVLRTPPKDYALRVNTLRASREEVVDFFTSRGARCKKSGHLDEAISIEVEGPFSVESVGARVLADKYAAESVMLGSNLYGPGVLRSEKVRPGDRAYVTDRLGHVVGRGIAWQSSAVRHGKGVAVATVESVYRLPAIRESELFAQGKIVEQSLPAMVTARVLAPLKGETVVDMCAAPGSKTLHIAQLQEDSGTIYAFENSPKRLKRMREEIQRLGIRSVKLAMKDSRYLAEDCPNLKADRVLVDPPCSALGVRPKLYEESSAKEVGSCANYQKQFLRTASRIVKKGGVVVYSTCTLTTQENEEIVGYGIDELGLELEEPDLRLGLGGIGGGALSKVQRFDPDVIDVPGYFIAKLIKK